MAHQASRDDMLAQLAGLDPSQLAALAQRLGIAIPPDMVPDVVDNDGSANIRPSAKALRLGQEKRYLTGQELRDFDREWSEALTAVDTGYMTPLAESCYLGQIKDVRSILDGPDAPPLSGVSTGLKAGYISAAVMAFVRADTMPPCPAVPEHLAIIQLLIERGAPADVVDARGDTALTLAALHGLDSPALIKILADAGANLNHCNKAGETALFSHALSGRVASVQALLDAGAQLEIDDAAGTSIASAFMQGGEAVTSLLKRFLSKHPDLPVRLPRKVLGVLQPVWGNDPGEDSGIVVSPELRALCARPVLRGEDAKRFNVLYATTAGALQLDKIGPLGGMALIGSARQTAVGVKVMPVLTDRLTELGLGLLHLSVLGFRAARNQRGLEAAKPFLDDMRWLVENGARHSPDLGGVHPISLACNTVDEPILIETLIELGADVNVANKLGRTPLFSAAAAGLSKIIPVLLKAGASLYVRDSDGVPMTTAFTTGKVTKILDKWTKAHPGAVVAGVERVQPDRQDGTGGIVLGPETELMRLARRPGYLKARDGGQRLLDLFRQASMSFNPQRLTPFGLDVFLGRADAVRKVRYSPCSAIELIGQAVEKGEAPDLLGSETGQRLGYAQLCVIGQQQVVGAKKKHHEDTLRVLHEFGRAAVFRHADLAGSTVLSFAIHDGAERPGLIDLLIKLGCDVNARNKLGSVAALHCMMENQPKSLARILRAPDVDLNIADADGNTPLNFYSRTGPEIAAVMQAHLRAESGAAPEPFQFVACANCNAKGKLACCGRCLFVLYCSPACAKAHWSEHKPTCEPFAKDALSFTTHASEAMPLSNILQGGRRHKPAKTADSGEIMIVKVQCNRFMPILVYNRDRSYMRQIERKDGPDDFDALSAAIQAHGIHGAGPAASAAKAYFRSRRAGDTLTIKLTRPLVAQDF